MFTGLVTAIGRIQSLDFDGHELHIKIHVEGFLVGTLIGDSISVNGCCLTVTACLKDSFSASISAQTLKVTNFSQSVVGDLLNLERSLCVGQELGGHWVSGHVDGLMTCISIQSVGGSKVIHFETDDEHAAFIAKKGSVTVDGVSLTVNDVSKNIFSVNVIPHTLSVTTLGDLSVGQLCHIEVDLMARYAARLVQHQVEGDHHASN